MAKNLIEDLARYFEKDKNVEIAILFGSFASGLQKNHSDIDIGIATKNSLTPIEKIKFIDDLSLITHRTIDLLDLKEVHVPISKEILSKGKVLKNSNNKLWEWLIRRMIYEVADFLPLRRKEQLNRIKKFTGKK